MVNNFLTTEGTEYTELGADARTSGSFVISTFRVFRALHGKNISINPRFFLVCSLGSARQ